MTTYLDYLDELEEERYYRYGETPRWLLAEEERLEEERAFEKESRYFDAPLGPERVSDDWLEDLAA